MKNNNYYCHWIIQLKMEQQSPCPQHEKEEEKRGESFYHGKKMSKTHCNLRCLSGQVIIVDGPIGAGKSTLVKSLGRKLKKEGFEKVKIYPEVVDHTLKTLFINNLNKETREIKERNVYAFPFQMDQIRNRHQVYKDAFDNADRGGISIVERSYTGDGVFANMQRESGNITKEGWEIYKNRAKDITQYEPLMTVYLKVTPEEAYDRTMRRNSVGETGYTMDYFKELNKKYDEMMKTLPEYMLLEIDWNKKNELELIIDELISEGGDNQYSYLLDETCLNVLDKMVELFQKRIQ